MNQGKWKKKDYKVSWNQQRTKRQRRTEKLRSPDMAQLGFQYVFKKKKKEFTTATHFKSLGWITAQCSYKEEQNTL